MYSRFGNMDSRTRVGSYRDPRTGNPQMMSEPAFNMSGANTPASGQALNAPRGGEDIGYVPQQRNTEATMTQALQNPSRYADSDFVANKTDELLRRTMTGYSPDDMLGMYDRGKQGEINPEYIQHFKANSGLDRVNKEMGAFRQLEQASDMLQGYGRQPRYGQPENRRPVNDGTPSTETLIRGADIISGNSPNVSPEQIEQLRAVAGISGPADVAHAEAALRMSEVRLRNAANRRSNSEMDYRILDEMNRREGIG